MELSVQSLEGRDYLDVTFTVAAPVGEAERASLPVYAFYATVGDCELTMSVYGYPSAAAPAMGGTGSPNAECEASGRDMPGGYRFEDNRVTVIVALGDLSAVVRGATLENLRAKTAFAHCTCVTADEAFSPNSWTIA